MPRKTGSGRVFALNALILQAGPLFFCDTHVNVDPSAEEIAEMTLMAAQTVRHFGLTPKVALLSHSNFGASNSPSAKKMRHALGLIRAADPELEVDGEMHADAALAEQIRHHALPDSTLYGTANLLIFPNHRLRQYRLQPGQGDRRRGDRGTAVDGAGDAAAYRCAQHNGARPY